MTSSPSDQQAVKRKSGEHEEATGVKKAASIPPDLPAVEGSPQTDSPVIQALPNPSSPIEDTPSDDVCNSVSVHEGLPETSESQPSAENNKEKAPQRKANNTDGAKRLRANTVCGDGTSCSSKGLRSQKSITPIAAKKKASLSAERQKKALTIDLPQIPHPLEKRKKSFCGEKRVGCDFVKLQNNNTPSIPTPLCSVSNVARKMNFAPRNHGSSRNGCRNGQKQGHLPPYAHNPAYDPLAFLDHPHETVIEKWTPGPPRHRPNHPDHMLSQNLTVHVGYARKYILPALSIPTTSSSSNTLHIADKPNDENEDALPREANEELKAVEVEVEKEPQSGVVDT